MGMTRNESPRAEGTDMTLFSTWKHLRALLLTVGVVLLVAARVDAQSAIAGQVTDTTGAVLPGVTVEAASPALIEGNRAGVTDGQGRYTIESLRPGTYKVTFTLPG